MSTIILSTIFDATFTNVLDGKRLNVRGLLRPTTDEPESTRNFTWGDEDLKAYEEDQKQADRDW